MSSSDIPVESAEKRQKHWVCSACTMSNIGRGHCKMCHVDPKRGLPQASSTRPVDSAPPSTTAVFEAPATDAHVTDATGDPSDISVSDPATAPAPPGALASKVDITGVPIAEVPVAQVPTTTVPTTTVPTTTVPTTMVPTTEAPTTEVPTNEVPTTEVRTSGVRNSEVRCNSGGPTSEIFTSEASELFSCAINRDAQVNVEEGPVPSAWAESSSQMDASNSINDSSWLVVLLLDATVNND